ncbi:MULTISPECIES: outer membrane protein [Mesorhizobium]|uniref:Opacity protein-like surface antigen n=1 Tax=Rhizobium loti TaxID=381 RepID=A0A8E3B5Y2_RHILI|nr:MULTISPECIES: outer membrane protein [Mesorhizobium]PWJ91812.1 opacity protein-like surface antigen [Mesorhizobium loti]RUX93836.1 porin family protein [Mesorhizobium sp. M7D.F.Ca.US.004.01.2.1]RVA29171.1 porin family protein [Mesorhizobium sp. M7D.F.Ca.US.004.03.1.1]
MFNTARKVLLALLFAGLAGPLFAADLPEPVVEEAPPPAVYEQPAEVGGWYIRGDIDYHKSTVRGIDYMTYTVDPCNCTVTPGSQSFDFGKLKGGFSLGAGVGYKINDHFRTDLTADYWFKSNFNGQTTGTAGGSPVIVTSAESSKMSALLLLANAYADLGTYHGITPYVGAGIGGAHVKWDTVYDPTPGATETNPGRSSWRFAYALMAGASYCLTDKIILDAGYRFSHIQGGRMFDWNVGSSGPGFDRGINTHEVRGGLRYQFGGNNGCAAPVVAYQPEPEPIYTK